MNKSGGRKTATVAPRAAVKAKPAAATKAAPAQAAKVPVKAAEKPAVPKDKSAAAGKVKSEHGAVVVPERAGDLKARFTALASTTSQIKTLKRAFQRNFYEIGELLTKIQKERLFEVKGYGSFESFAEREMDLGTQTCVAAARIFQTLQRDAAIAAGVERATAAVMALDGGAEPVRESSPLRHVGMSAVPLHKQ